MSGLGAPDPARARANYRRLAPRYDGTCTRVMPIRHQAVARLGLAPGQSVIDVAAGTGLSIPLLLEAVGPRGHVVALEHSPEMMAIARRRAGQAGWTNVTFVEASAEEARIPGPLDAALFHFTHDVLQSPAALANIFGALRPGAQVCFAGLKLTRWRLYPVDAFMLWRARHYLTTFRGMREPWALAQPWLGPVSVTPRLFDTAYIGFARVAFPGGGAGAA